MATKIAMASVCGVFTFIGDILFMYFGLHKISLHVPVRDQYNQQNPQKCCDKTYPLYFFKPEKQKQKQLQSKTENKNNQNKQDPLLNDQERKISAELELEEYKISQSRCSCATHCYPIIVFSFCLRTWNISCGLLFMVLQITFMINMIFQFLVACYRENISVFIFGGIVSLYIGYVLLWILGHSLNATLLLWKNVSNEFNTNIQYHWNIAQLLVWFLYVMVCSVDDEKTFDQEVWPTMLEWLIVRGMIWVLLFTIIAIFVNIYVVYHVAINPFISNKKSHNKVMDIPLPNMNDDDDADGDDDDADDDDDDNPSLFINQKANLLYLNWEYFLFGITVEDKQRSFLRIKYEHIKKILFVIFIIFFILTFIVYFIYKSYAFIFASIMLIIYYLIIAILDKVDFDSLYCIWSGKYHRRFWSNLRKFWNKTPPKYKAPQQQHSQLSQLSPVNVELSVSDDVKVDEDDHDVKIETLELLYLDLWCQFVDKYQYFCGFRCKYKKKSDLKKKKKRKCKCTPWIISLIKIIVILFVVMAPFSYYLIKINQRTNKSAGAYNGNPINWENVNNSSPYPMCKSLHINNINMLDLVYLSNAIYYPNRTDINNSLNTWFGDNIWNISHVYQPGDIYQSAYAHIAKQDTDLILVRGTDSSNDIIQDLSLWSEIGILQLVSWGIPITTITSTDFLREYVYYASLWEGLIEPALKTNYYNPVYKYVNTHLNDSIINNKKTIIILGHSLGGGIAQIVAGKLLKHEDANNVLSFGLASPGTQYSSKKFGFTTNALHETSISVLPERDLVSQIDAHGGEIQYIKCEGENAVDCHVGITHFCQIAKTCGKIENIFNDENKKDFIECACGNETHPAQLMNACWNRIAQKL